MRVVVTRPLAKAERTIARLAGLGHEAVLLPLFKPVYHPFRAKAALSEPFSAVAVTSGEALKALEGEPAPGSDVLAMPLFAVGAATASAAREFGFRNVAESQGDGAELARLMTARRGPREDRPVLYLAGTPRARRFERTLEESAVPLKIVEAYEMVADPLPLEDQQRLLVEQRVDIVLFYSRRNAEAFFNLPVFAASRAALDKTLFLCISRNVADAVPDEFRKKAIIAMRPDEDALLDLL